MNKTCWNLIVVATLSLILIALTFGLNIRFSEFAEKENPIANVTTQNFEELVQESDKTVLLWFWSLECEPSLEIEPDLNQLAITFANDLLVYSVDLDKYPNIGIETDIERIPTLIYYNHGSEFKRIVGVRSIDMLEIETRDAIDMHLKG